MAYDAALADRLRALLAAEAVEEKAMFGGLAFLVGGNMSVAASGNGGLLVRVDPSDSEALLAEPGATEMRMGGRGPMKGWLHVAPEDLDDAALKRWTDRGLTYAKALPAKKPR